MAPLARLRRCPLHGMHHGAECRDCAEKPIYELALEVLAHDSAVFLIEPVRRIVEAAARFPIVRTSEYYDSFECEDCGGSHDPRFCPADDSWERTLPGDRPVVGADGRLY